MTAKTALVLAGHGSHISPNTAGLVWEQVDQLRALGVADEVTATFWKEMPSFHTVFNSLEATDITVVPLFTAQGYFTQTVIPAEMGLTGAITELDGRTIRYTRTLGEHSYLFKVIEERLDDARRILNAPPEVIAVAIIGHSTRRNPDSRKAAEAQVAYLREQHRYAQVEAVYLDDSPAIADIYTMTSAPNIIAIPFFLAEGSHTTIDVVRELGLNEDDPSRLVNGRQVFYTSPVGLTQKLPDIILELAREAGAPLKPPSEGSAWDCFPAVLRDSLWKNVLQGPQALLGQLRLTMTEVTHEDDDNRTETITELDDLRRRVRENPFRPLATSSDLPRGWRVPVENDLNRLHAIVETIYPGVIGGILGYRPGMDVLKATVSRQTGQYRQLERLTSLQVETVVKKVCGRCVLRPKWFKQNNHWSCLEPCNFWLSAAMKELNEEGEE